MQIIVYTTATCPYCKMLKNYFDAKQVNYTEKLVDQDDAAKEEMMKASGGFLGVPFTLIEKGPGMTETVVGFDKERLNSLIGISE
jgi:glutaredoxin 3